MSSIVANENVVVVVVEKKPKAKSLSQKDKKTLFSIMGFLLNLKEQGVLDDEKVMECLEALPLYKTAAEKTAFFQQDMFNTKKVEDELYKPMLSDYKKAKKEKRTKKEKKQVSADGEKKKPRAKKTKVVADVEENPVADVEEKLVADVEEKPVANEPIVKEKKPRAKKEVVEGEPKRGRKPKQQLVELAQDVSTDSVEEESLDMLIQSMNVKETAVEEIQVEDIDDMMRELEAEEIQEEKKVEETVSKPKKKIQKVKKPVENKVV
jgi:hypothetical protein